MIKEYFSSMALLIKDVYSQLPIISAIPIDFGILLFGILIGHFYTKNFKSLARYSTWAVFVFMFYSTLKYWMTI